MKVYHSNSEKPQKKGGKTAIISLTVCSVLVVVAIALALGLTLRDNDAVKSDLPATTNPIVYTMPIDGATTGQTFCITKLVYNKTLNQWRTHNGVDFMADRGTEVKAIYGGKVLEVKVTNLEGTVVTVDHGDGLVATYKGLEDVELQGGETVEAGDKLGVVGTMMTESLDGYHLHLETTRDGKLVDPMNYLSPSQDK